ncbi:MAG TPA: hypothetical protein VGO79_14200 [Thermoanaerobaculia bacterium]|jgi:NO-binding membrane sensor protein with MHYT domain
MNWTLWLGLAVLISVIFAVTALKPRGARSVGHTRLLGVARVILLLAVLILFYLAFFARTSPGH